MAAVRKLRTPAPAAAQTVREIVALEQREKVRMTFSDRVADALSSFAGSMLFVWLHVAWFGVWILINSNVVGLDVDPFPFNFLTMAVSLEAIFLSTFVLISENRQAVLSDKRAKLDLEVSMISEREVTKLISMVARVADHLGISVEDAEAERMQRPTHVRELADEMEEVEEKMDREAAEGPHSAVDTRA